MEKAARHNGLKIKVVEKAGTTLKGTLQRSNPFGKNVCGRGDCPMCSRGIFGLCRERGCVYEIRCKADGRVYPGQTGRSMYERVTEEMRAWRNGLNSSPLVRHSDLYHGGGEFEVNIAVTQKCFGKPSKRLITESVMIDGVDSNKTMNSKREWTYVNLNKVGLG